MPTFDHPVQRRVRVYHIGPGPLRLAAARGNHMLSECGIVVPTTHSLPNDAIALFRMTIHDT